MPAIATGPVNRTPRYIPKGILDQFGDGVVALNSECRVIFANSAAERLLGRRTEELLNQVLWRVLPVDEGGTLERECHRAIADQLPRNIERYNRATDTWFEERLFPSKEGITIHIRDITLQKRQQIAQKDREKWYSALVNSIGGIVWVADAETFQFSFVSKQAEQVLGYPVDQWLKEPDFWRKHVHPDDVGWCIKFCYETSAKRLDHDFEYRMIAADGRVVWLRDIVSVKVEDGVPWLRGIMLDITEQKLVEERLQRKEEHFRNLVENAWDSVAIVTQDGTILYISPAIERVLGYKPEEMLGRIGALWLHPDDVERGRMFREGIFANQLTGTCIEYRVRHKDGSWRTLESIGKPYVDEHGRLVAVINTRDITDRSRIEAQLRESEARFRLLFERNAAGMTITGIDYRFMQVNPAFCRMLGYTEHELLQKTAIDITHPDDRRETQLNVERVKEGRQIVTDMEKRYLHKNGSTVWGHLTAIYILSDGHPVYCIGTIQDITDRKQAAEALKVSEARYRSLVLASEPVVWITNADGEAVNGQPSWGALTGQSEGEIRGWGWLDAVHPDDRIQAEHIWREALKNKIHYQNEFRIRTAQGRYRNFTVRGAPVRDSDGSVREWVGTCTDITDQKRAAADIVKWKNRYEAAVTASGQLLYDLNLTTQEVTYGGNLNGMLGYSHSEMSGGIEQWIALIHPDDRNAFRREAERSHRSHEPFHLEYRVRRKDGDYRVVNDEGRFYPYVNGSIGSMIGFVSDITEQKNTLLQLADAKEKAEAASRAKDDFIAALSHELRTPLNPVLMLTSEMEQSTELPDSARQDFAMIRKNVELEARIIDDLLDLTRITRGKVHLNLRQLETHTIVRQALEVVHNEIESKQLRLVLELSATEDGFSGDPVRLQQVFWNVLKNAVKFTPVGGTVTVRSRNTTGHKLLLEFADSGSGIAPEDLPHIFEAFVQGASAGGHQFGGLGLGLTITRQVVELHHGRIWAESAGRGRGSTFYIEFPLTPSGAREPQTNLPSSEPVAPRFAGFRILLVEDHEPTRVTLSRLLSRQGYQVLSADSLASARNLAAHNHFDLVTSDIGLPDGNGCDLMAELRDEYGLKGIALSGYGMEEDVRRSLQAGFAVHLTKPVDIQSLKNAIADVERNAHPVG